MSETVSTVRWQKPRRFAQAQEFVSTNIKALLRPSMRLALGSTIGAVSAVNLVFFYSRGVTNLYGDALAHLESARRLWDSLTPGIEEIGSAWLPLFHILVSPLTRSEFLW